VLERESEPRNVVEFQLDLPNSISYRSLLMKMKKRIEINENKLRKIGERFKNLEHRLEKHERKVDELPFCPCFKELSCLKMQLDSYKKYCAQLERFTLARAREWNEE